MPETERAVIEAEFSPGYALLRPDFTTTPLVFSSPHSGRVYPEHFLAQSRLDPLTLRKSEDCYVDVLFGSAPSYGAPLLAALFPRAFLDVNREPYELDPSLFRDPLPDYANKQSTRVIGGLGTIARVVGDGAEIYRSRLSLACALRSDRRPVSPVSQRLTRLAHRHLPYVRKSHPHRLSLDAVKFDARQPRPS